MSETPFETRLNDIYGTLRSGLLKNSRDYEWRISQLKALKRLLVENDQALCDAMWADLRKSKFECIATEQGIVLSEIDHAIKHLSIWMEPERVSTPLYNWPGHCEILHDSLGLTLIIGAWNYPINLLLAPMVGALSGGNGVILKPSELAVQTAALLARLIPQYMDRDLIQLIEAGPEETGILLDKPFDLIFFTGSGPVGKIVMTKAAQNLTPVILELGGKSPAIVLADANLEVSAKRIAWGKFMNAGQTCVAPDYVLVAKEVKQKLIEEIKKNLLLFYGTDAEKSPDYCRIINARNFDRLTSYLKDVKILHGGRTAKDTLYIEPTLLESTTDSEVMKGEIFGPILPILELDNLDHVIELINARPKPLALYLFTSSANAEDKILSETSAGGVCVNDVVMHMPIADFPFGGVGASGMGHYHGKFSFDAFTHAKGVLHKATWLDVPVRYAPYTLKKSKWLRRLFS
jgi:aldehyde dehydrogenase (NAD+)